jgi:rhodanese-related sulfurtransferase
MQHTSRFLKIVEQSRARVKECTVRDVESRLAAGQRLNLIDVREESEYARGHIPGARHIGKGVIERDIEQFFPDPGVELILYCGGGYRSALAADALGQMGYTNVISMDGGWRGWREAGLPAEA